MRISAFLLVASLSIARGWAQCTDCDGDGFAPPSDCDDGSAIIHPGAAEVCDGLDNDCDGFIDGLEGCDGSCPSSQEQGDDQRLNDPATNKAADPAIVWTGSEYGVVWGQGSFGQQEIFFARLSADGLPLGPPVQVTFGSGISSKPRLAWNGSGYGVTWMKDSGIFFERIDAFGQRTGDEVFVTTGLMGHALVWTGSGYGVVCDDFVPDGAGNNSEIFFARLDPQGSAMGPVLRVTNAPGTSLLPDVAWTGSEFGLAWYDGRGGINTQIYFARLAADGTKIGAEVPVASRSTDQFVPEIEWSGTEFGLVWTESAGGGLNSFARLDASGSPVGLPVNVSNSMADPALIRTGNGYGVAAHDSVGRLSFQDLSATGQLVGNPVALTTADASTPRPVIAWSGRNFGVAWTDYRLGAALPGVFFTLVDCGPAVEILAVAIDILPGSDDNVIRLGSQGSLPVAILSTDDFDATTVDPASVRLAGAPPRLDAKGDPDCHFEDVDRDHRTDLLCKIDKAAVQLHPGDTVAVLEATTLDGTPVRGEDTVRVLAGKAPHLLSTTRWPGGVTPVP